MKFNKALLVGIDKSALGKDYWRRLEKVIAKFAFLPKDSKEMQKQLADSDCLLVGFGIEVNKDHINGAPNLKYIGTLATAFGKVDTACARKKKIPVCNLAGYSTEAVAEFTIAAILEYLRKLQEGKLRGKAGNYSESGLQAAELKGKKFGVLGLGSIGNRVAELAQGFDSHVSYWSRHRKKEPEARGIKYEDANSLIATSDFISINLAETKGTEKFLSSKRINSLKKGAVVINTTPMELVDVDALITRLKKKDITFLFDHSDETNKEDMKKLSKYENCIIYPPIAYITNEAQVVKQEMFVANIENFLKGSPTNVVN